MGRKRGGKKIKRGLEEEVKRGEKEGEKEIKGRMEDSSLAGFMAYQPLLVI